MASSHFLLQPAILSGDQMLCPKRSTLLKCALSLMICVGVVGVVHAEGGCPQGQYPIGGQGVGGCAPIPTSGGEANSSPKPTGRWIKTWGAIATASNGASGTITGKLKKADAVNAAMDQCKATGASGCNINFTYKNQCVAASIATSGFGGTQFSTAAELEEADSRSLQDCKNRGGQGCEVIYHACTDPYFEKF